MQAILTDRLAPPVRARCECEVVILQKDDFYGLSTEECGSLKIEVRSLKKIAGWVPVGSNTDTMPFIASPDFNNNGTIMSPVVSDK